jgi:ParB family chromosome partitioning protein
MDETKEIPLDAICWNEPTDITEEQINNMAASILVHGQIEPIIVNVRDEKGYRGVVGRLRYEGMKKRWKTQATGKTILARVHKFDSENELRTWQLVENLHRREVPAMQRARQYRALHDLLREEHGEEATIKTLTMAIEDSTGNKESLKTVQHYLSLTTLEPETQQILTREQMSLRHGLELLRVKSPKAQVKIAKQAEDQKLNIQDVKWKVDEALVTERQAQQTKRLEKKAKELRDQGITVYLDVPYTSWEQHNKDSKKYKQFWGEVPQKCQSCSKKGVLLEGNFQQKPLCTDLKCYEEMEKQEHIDSAKELKAREAKLDEDQAKVYNMEPDVRHWRLAVFGLVDHWELTRILQVKEARFARDEDVLWLALNKLDEKECQSLLIRKAVEEILTGPESYRDSTVKKWAVKEFNLTSEVFLSPEEEE